MPLLATQKKTEANRRSAWLNERREAATLDTSTWWLEHVIVTRAARVPEGVAAACCQAICGRWRPDGLDNGWR
jgi:hypothetical protein